jgi:hypothetical protein
MRDFYGRTDERFRSTTTSKDVLGGVMCGEAAIAGIWVFCRRLVRWRSLKYRLSDPILVWDSSFHRSRHGQGRVPGSRKHLAMSRCRI